MVWPRICIYYCMCWSNPALSKCFCIFVFLSLLRKSSRFPSVEGLYCKRPIKCLASSEILTPHPLTTRRVCTPPPLMRGEDTLAGWRGGGGGGSIVRKTPDTALYSIYVSTLCSQVTLINFSSYVPERWDVLGREVCVPRGICRRILPGKDSRLR